MTDPISHPRAQINERLAALVAPDSGTPKRLSDAAAHTVLASGKRFRPLLTVLIAKDLGYDGKAALDIGCAGELVHTASLILDDLPCMDDAPLRRGKTSAHIAFGESTAILTAVALLNRAFGLIARCEALPHDKRSDVSSRLSYAVGANGLIAGQLSDLSNDDTSISIEEVERLNQLKTGALFDYAVLSAGVLAGADEKTHDSLTEFSKQLGLAFQLLDDLKDSLMSDDEAQKTTGRDAGKATLVALTGDEAAKARLQAYLVKASIALKSAGIGADSLVSLAMAQQFSFLK